MVKKANDICSKLITGLNNPAAETFIRLGNY